MCAACTPLWPKTVVDDQMRQVRDEITAEARDNAGQVGHIQRELGVPIFDRYALWAPGLRAYGASRKFGRSKRGRWDTIAERFHAQHFTTYDYNAPDEPIQLVNLRVSAIGKFGADFHRFPEFQ